MLNIFKRSKKVNSFHALGAFPYKDYYFIRKTSWDWMTTEKIYINDPKSARILTVDPWMQILFLAANGQTPVSEYVQYVASKYTGKIPVNLDETIIGELNRLIQHNLIELSGAPRKPLPEHNLSQSEMRSIGI